MHARYAKFLANWSRSSCPERHFDSTSCDHTVLNSSAMSIAFPVANCAMCPQWPSCRCWRKFWRWLKGPLHAFIISTHFHHSLSSMHSRVLFRHRPIFSLYAWDCSIWSSSIPFEAEAVVFCFFSLSFSWTRLSSQRIARITGMSLSGPQRRNCFSGMEHPFHLPEVAFGQSFLQSCFAEPYP